MVPKSAMLMPKSQGRLGVKLNWMAVCVNSPVTNVPRTNLIDAFQRLQSARQAIDPKNDLGHREGHEIGRVAGHENDCLCSVWALRSARSCGTSPARAIGVPEPGRSLSLPRRPSTTRVITSSLPVSWHRRRKPRFNPGGDSPARRHHLYRRVTSPALGALTEPWANRPLPAHPKQFGLVLKVNSCCWRRCPTPYQAAAACIVSPSPNISPIGVAVTFTVAPSGMRPSRICCASGFCISR